MVAKPQATAIVESAATPKPQIERQTLQTGTTKPAQNTIQCDSVHRLIRYPGQTGRATRPARTSAHFGCHRSSARRSNSAKPRRTTPCDRKTRRPSVTTLAVMPRPVRRFTRHEPDQKADHGRSRQSAIEQGRPAFASSSLNGVVALVH